MDKRFGALSGLIALCVMACSSAEGRTSQVVERAAACPVASTEASSAPARISHPGWLRPAQRGCAMRPRASLVDSSTGRFWNTGMKVPETFPIVRDRITDQNLWTPTPRPLFDLSGPRRQIPDVTAPKDLKVVILMVEFPDKIHDASISKETIENTFVGTISSGSMREYYREISYGQLDVSGTSYGWNFVTSSSRCGGPALYSCYACGQSGLCSSEPNSVTLAKDAVREFDSTVDFSKFDGDGDGFIDAVFVVHPGLGAEESGGSEDLWSSMTSVPNSSRDPAPMVDGVRIRDFIVVPEKSCIGPASNPCSRIGAVNIGVIAHEFGHILQLPDVYDVNQGSDGVGIFDIMGTGAYGADNASPHQPTHMSAWLKSLLGWLVPRRIETDACDVQLLPIEQNPDAIRIDANGPNDPQYFLLENRQKIGFDGRLPGTGMLIYHVDETICEEGFFDNTVNVDPSHKCLDIEEAHGKTQQLDTDRDSDQGAAADFYPGTTQNTRFARDTDPSSAPYLSSTRKDAEVKVAVSEIKLTGDLITFCASGVCPGTAASSGDAPEQKPGGAPAGGGGETVNKAPPTNCGCHSFGASGLVAPPISSTFPLLAGLAYLLARRRVIQDRRDV